MPTTDRTASRILIYLTEELGDARLRAAQLQKYVADATDLIEKSAHRDHFFEVAGHLIHGIPQTVFKLSKALDASALAAARLDYEEIKQGLKPEKADELEAVMEDTRLRYLNRRSHEEPMKPKQASDILLALADRTKEAGRVPVTPLLQLIASLEAPTGRVASQDGSVAQKAEQCFREAAKAILEPGSTPSRLELASLMRRVLADTIQPTSSAIQAAIFAQATTRQDVIDGFMSANPAMSKEDAEKAADEWEKNKDVVKNKTAGAGEAFQKVNPAITDEQVEKINEMHEKHKDNFKTAGALNPAAVNAFRDLLLPQVWNSLIRPVAYASGDMLDKLGAAERSHWDGELGQALIKRMPSRSSMDVFKDDIEDVIAHWYKNAKNQLAAESMPRTASDETSEDKEARHPEGKDMTLEEVTEGMSEEDKAKFKKMHDEHGDQFKKAMLQFLGASETPQEKKLPSGWVLKWNPKRPDRMEVNDEGDSGWSDEAIRYRGGKIVYDSPERIPSAVRGEVEKFFRKVKRTASDETPEQRAEGEKQSEDESKSASYARPGYGR